MKNLMKYSHNIMALIQNLKIKVNVYYNYYYYFIIIIIINIINIIIIINIIDIITIVIY